MMRWQVWYADGTHRRGTTAEEWAALPPADCLIAKVWADGAAPTLWAGYDALVWTPSGPRGVDLPIPEFEAVAATLAAEGQLKYGRLVSDAVYEQRWTEAIHAESP
jgi:hypothetical protein